MTGLTTIDLFLKIDDAIAGHGFVTSTEAELGEHVAYCLEAAAVKYEREVILDARNRLDFLVGGVAVELKIKGGVASLLRQLDRYAQFEQVQAILVVTTRRQLCGLPSRLRGKPVRALYVGTF